MKIGFIGLGNIGYPMAAQLLEAGFDLTVHDLIEDKAKPLVERGAAWGASLGETVSGAETIITSLPGPTEVTQVFEGSSGLLSCLKPGQTWIEMSTSDRALITRISTELAAKQVQTLEATVTGGVANAYSGNITVFVGGEREAFLAHTSIFDALAGKVVYLGGLGNATVAKLITNMLAFVHEAVLAEGLILGKRAGVELTPLLEAIQNSYAGSFVADVDGPRILAGSYGSSFAVKLALKDMRLTQELATELEIPLAFGALVTNALQRSQTEYGPDSDTLLMVKRIEQETGVQLQTE